MYVKHMGRKGMATGKKAVPASKIRRNPLVEVVDYGDLVIARDLMKRGPIPEFWADHPMPAAPLGHTRWEGTRQIATFLVPLIAMIAGVKLGGWNTLWISAPLSLVFGWLMDRSLEADIAKTRKRDESIDRGRYRAVQILSAHLGIPRDEITLAMVAKMAKDCELVEAEIECRRVAREEAKHKEIMNRVRRQEAAYRSKGSHRHAAVTAAVAAGSVASQADSDGVLPEDLYPSFPQVNPGSGLPMAASGMMLDIAGNAFGTGGFDH